MAQPSVEQTAEIAKAAHGEQTDQIGDPYWMHLYAVNNLLPTDATEDERRVALLHDVLEDTTLTAADLTALGFSDEVVKAVELLTKPRDRHGTYFEWIRSIADSGNRMAIRVKVADNTHNSDPERVARLRLRHAGFNLDNRYALSLCILRQALDSHP